MSITVEEDDNSKPVDSDVFVMTNGEKVRLSFDKIYSYSSKAKTTTVQYGYAYDNLETFNLDIDFDSFDGKLQDYKEAMKNYYGSYDCY